MDPYLLVGILFHLLCDVCTRYRNGKERYFNALVSVWGFIFRIKSPREKGMDERISLLLKTVSTALRE
ncbi:hypothetical protein BCV73_33275 [Paenibacillus sp. SSG-1]|nr:hypothetical protein BCV73_33275 [Paenibacillus sp. SSG-1]GIO63466.1 hypothetical protein J43TS9_50400 [Paenibacillus cineris]